MELNEKIDVVLMLLKDKQMSGYQDSTSLIYMLREKGRTVGLIGPILEQLKREDLVDITWDGHQDKYRISHSGEVLLASGGYHSAVLTRSKIESDRLTREENLDKYMESQKESAHSISKLTWWIAGGTIVAAIYYLLEILNHIFHLYKGCL